MSLLEISACGTILILAAAVLRRLRLPKEACMVLWWASAARLLLPWKLPARCSVYTLLEALRTPLPPPASVPANRPVMVLPPVIPVVPASPETVDPAAAPFPLWTALWLAGAGLLALWFLVSYIRWQRRFRESLPAECGFLRQWKSRHPRIQVRVSDRIAAPLTYGLIRPVVLLPKAFDLSDESALLCVLTHEDIHIRRLDGLLKLLLTAALCVHWFNPAVWLLRALASRDMELRCDLAAVERLGKDRRAAYALTLLRMAELRNASMPLCSSFSESGMEERIQAIMKFKKPSVLALAAAVTLALCVTAVFATSAWKPPVSEKASGASAEPASPLLELKESIRFDNGTFSFTIPAGESRWNIWISGHVLTALDEESGAVMSVRCLEAESEKGEWISGKTYSFSVEDAAYGELVMTEAYGGEELAIDLLPFLPEGLAPLEVPEPPEFKANIPDGAEMIWPVDSEHITSAVGSFHPGSDGAAVHHGIDIGGLEKGDPIYAAGAGTVKAAGFDSHDGNYILLDHGNGLESYYSSCGAILVQTGSTVKMGQCIATAGQSGMSTGPHLHFEIRRDGVTQNPLDLLSGDSGSGTASVPFYADRDGTVLYACKTSAGDYSLWMDYDGEAYAYNGCTAVEVQAGDAVRQGDLLGMSHGRMSCEDAGPVDTTDRTLSGLAKEYLVDGEYPRNKNGQTYAPNEMLTALLGYPPDLVSGIASNGQKGYLSLKELNGGVRLLYGVWRSYTDPDASEDRSIPVYDEAGDVIGEFVITAGNPSEA